MTDVSTEEHLFHLADRVIGLITLVVGLLALVVVGLLAAFFYLLFQPQGANDGAAAQMLQVLILKLWEQTAPYVAQFIHLVSPIVILLFALGVLHRLGKEGATPFDSSKLLADLPSVLALVIIVTICLLPLSGIEVPEVLNNIALVVVGFYFGKRKTADES
jgi:hypothetical protein